MGMSASQARLLSITARLTNNEFRSQTITNSKLRLAEKSSEASQEYMDALNSQQLMFGVYDDNGNYTKQDLTPALIYDYAPLKNQYALINTAGKMLVSNQDAENFENSNTLYEFLDKYDLVKDVELMDDYEADYANYLKLMEDYNKELADYNEKMAKYLKDLAAYEASLDQADLYAIFSGAVGTSDIKDGPELDGSMGCYWHALNPVDQNSASCYEHVLNHLIDFDGTMSGNNDNGGRYTTSYKDDITICQASTGYMGNQCNDKMKQVSKAINDTDADGNLIRFCDGTDNYQNLPTGYTNMLEKAIEDYGTGAISITEYKLYVLLSDYVENPDGTFSVKTLKQKAIDLMYVARNWGPALSDDDPEMGEFPESMLSRDFMVNMLINFTDGDMRNVGSTTPPGNPPQKPNPPPEPEKPEFDISLNDKDKAQWYINLWHYMNGSETANKVGTKVLTYNGKDETVHWVTNSDKSGKGGTYEVFEDLSLYKSSDWLQFALEHGMVTMYQAQYNNPALDSGKVSELTSEGVTWTSIIYTNASDITQQDDETAIAIAEVKYKNAVTEIENKDKKYDQDLKKLDTEHSALQTEYDSIKEVIGKNVDRSFKAFS